MYKTNAEQKVANYINRAKEIFDETCFYGNDSGWQTHRDRLVIEIAKMIQQEHNK